MKHLRRRDADQRPAEIRASFRSRWALVVLTLSILAVSAMMVWNAMSLRAALDRRTKQYVSDVSLQLSKDIDNRLSRNILDLETIADTWMQLSSLEDPDTAASFLGRKAQQLGFDALAILDESGVQLSTAPLDGEVGSLPGVRDSLAGGNGVSFLDGQSILYSVPLVRDGEVVGALGGVRDKENLQRLIQPTSFAGQGLTCIVHTDGSLIVSPTELEPFLQLESIFQKGDGETARDIEQMLADMAAGRSGTFLFTAVDGTGLALSYQPLDSYHWVLLTLVPDDIISCETDTYIAHTFLLVAGMIALFAVILVLLFYSYRRHYRQLTAYAFVDRATGGMNEAAFQLQCGRLLRAAPPGTCTVVSLQLQDFRLIGENFGSRQAEATLRYVMRTLRGSLREGELAARTGMDVFCLCLREGDPEAVRARISDLIGRINAFNRELEHPYYLTVQPGAYLVDDGTQEVAILQARAREASGHRTADQDGVCIFYDASFTRRLQRERELNGTFETSLKNRDFEVYLQPKVWTDSGKIGGAEALIRWRHPQFGLLSPGEFIPLFEQNGKICRLDLYVWEEVCRLLRRWGDAGLERFPVSVNLSRQHFRDPDFLLEFKAIADRYGVPARLLELELTESIFFDDQGIERVKHMIDEMHRLGFCCSLDDFGAGYSSLGLLMEFDVDAIKLDRRFFLDVSRPKTGDVVRCIVELAEKIGADVVAEGIETPEQLAFLRTVGCRLVQGYIYSPPLPVPAFERRWVYPPEK